MSIKSTIAATILGLAALTGLTGCSEKVILAGDYKGKNYVMTKNSTGHITTRVSPNNTDPKKTSFVYFDSKILRDENEITVNWLEKDSDGFYTNTARFLRIGRVQEKKGKVLLQNYNQLNKGNDTIFGKATEEVKEAAKYLAEQKDARSQTERSNLLSRIGVNQ